MFLNWGQTGVALMLLNLVKLDPQDTNHGSFLDESRTSYDNKKVSNCFDDYSPVLSRDCLENYYSKQITHKSNKNVIYKSK